jgi:hypothetical protein
MTEPDFSLMQKLEGRTGVTDSDGATADVATTGGSGGGSGGSMDTKEYIVARLGEARAQTDARFTEVISKVDFISRQLSDLPGIWKIVGVTATVAGVSLGLVFSILSFAGDRFDVGMTAGSVNDALSRQNAEVIGSLVASSQDQDRRLEAILQAVQAGNTASE